MNLLEGCALAGCVAIVVILALLRWEMSRAETSEMLVSDARILLILGIEPNEETLEDFSRNEELEAAVRSCARTFALELIGISGIPKEVRAELNREWQGEFDLTPRSALSRFIREHAARLTEKQRRRGVEAAVRTFRRGWLRQGIELSNRNVELFERAMREELLLE